MKTLHGVGDDWPFDYQELEPYLCEAEETMGVAGAECPQYPRSRPYAHSPHALNNFDKALQKHFPDSYTAMPSARASSINVGRPACCNNGVCSVCPIQAKFQIDLHMRGVYADPRVTLVTSAEVTHVDIQGSIAKGVYYKKDEKALRASGDVIAVGAHAIMTPAILLRSGLNDAALGKYLNEQVNVPVRINLKGLKGLNGGQRVSGLGAMFVNEADRATTPGCLIEGYNIPWLRAEHGRWREVAHIQFGIEDIPDAGNRVTLGADGKPEVHFVGTSDYMKAGLKAIGRRVDKLLAQMPVEDYMIELEDGVHGGAAHIQGTTRMGLDPATSVVDPQLVHHRVRNLLALGAGAFPTCPAANPTMPLSALSIRAARKMFA